jgi:hypothetical protein
MPPKASSKSSANPKRRSAPGRKSQKARSHASRPLRANSDPVRKQKWHQKAVEPNAYGLPNLEMLDLMNRTVTAFMGLPLRMARCRTPLDAWNEQSRLLSNIVADCQSLAFCIMTGGFVPNDGSTPQRLTFRA